MKVKVFQCYNRHVVLVAVDANSQYQNDFLPNCTVCKSIPYGSDIPMTEKGRFWLVSDEIYDNLTKKSVFGVIP